MRGVLVLSFLAVFGSGCATFGFTDDQKKLVETVSFDQNCPVDQIQVVKRFEGGMGLTKYVLMVCGKEMRYNRMGTGYFEDGKEPMPVR